MYTQQYSAVGSGLYVLKVIGELVSGYEKH